MRIAAIDQGTTSTKALIVADDGSAVDVGGLRHAQKLPRTGWVGHDAGELLANVRALIDRAASLGMEGIALANQGETVVAWDRRTGRPLADAIVWHDRRTEAQVAALAAAGMGEAVKQASGLPLDPYFSASKLRWLLDNAEGAGDLARQGRLGLGTSDAYFIERLTGRYATDVTTASRTSLMNLGACAWDTGLCAIFGVPANLLPEIVADAEPFGTVATPCGPRPLAASVVDQIAALYGHGCRKPGEGKVTVGTGAFALMLTGFAPPSGLKGGALPTAAWQTRLGRAYAADGGVYTAAAAIEWLIRIGMMGDAGELADLSGHAAAGRDLFFVPALSGLACPHWDRKAAGLFIGMDTATDRQDMVKATVEGVAFRVAEVIETLGFGEDSGTPVPVDGGLSRSSYFLQFLADVCSRPVVVPAETELTAIGAAGLALAAASKTDAHDFAPARQAAQRVTPNIPVADAQALRQRFAEARLRSEGWRR